MWIRVLCLFALLLTSLEGALQSHNLKEINQTTSYYLKKSTLTPLARMLFEAYLAQAQNDFAYEMLKEKGSFQGSFVPVSLGIWNLFQPATIISEYEDQYVDPDSSRIAAGIVEKYKARLLKESKGIKNYPVREGPGFWTSDKKPYGMNFGSLMPWHLKKCDQFRCPPIDHKPAFYRKELEALKGHMKGLNLDKLTKINYWAYQADWSEIANTYMDERNTPLELRLKVNATLKTGLSDAMGAAFDAKYAYWIPRPAMLDLEIQPVIQAPTHPSYPSGHSTVGATAKVILTHFFPENKSEWDRLAEESGMSRLWAGIHFPMDHNEGKILGEKVGKQVVSE
ncbi:MAG: vanadium-dependent haloperoxidase [Chlamydiia bacterium]|nr:vanadium-dependent haloperoxidase [Chlamydiia bacterium]